MVVDYPPLSSVDFAAPDFCFLGTRQRLYSWEGQSSPLLSYRLTTHYSLLTGFQCIQRTRVMSCTQFVSQVLPSSGEAACSQWHVVGVMLDQRKRARTRFPATISSP